MMKRVLVIVDPQNDFITGSLPVPGASEAMAGLVRWMQTNEDDFDAIVLTMDQHPYNHCSFVEQGGLWPAHCVRYSHGAAIEEGVHTEVCRQAMAGKPLVYLEKATTVERDSYSAFAESVCDALLDASHIYLAGLAGDYCVAESHRDLARHLPEVKIQLIEEGIAYITPPQA